MALDESVLSELLAAFQSGEGLDLIRESVRPVCQELIETEVSALIGAGRHERSDDRTNERNGHRSRSLTTKAGDVELAIHKLRRGSFFPAHRPGPLRGRHGGLRPRGLDAFGRRDGRSHGVVRRDLKVRGQPHLCRSRRGRRGLPGPPARPRPFSLHLARRHVHARARRPSGDLQGRHRHRGDRGGRREILGIEIGDSEDEAF